MRRHQFWMNRYSKVLLIRKHLLQKFYLWQLLPLRNDEGIQTKCRSGTILAWYSWNLSMLTRYKHWGACRSTEIKSHLNSVLAWYSLEIISAWCYLTRQAMNLNFWDKPDSVDSNNNHESLFILCLASRSCVVNVLNQRTKCSTYFCKHENLNCTNSGDLQFASSKTANLQGFMLSSLYWNNI